MNIDANVQRILSLLLKKWKILVVIGVLGAMLAYFYTSSFTTLTYASTVEFLFSTVDTQQELSDSSSSTTTQTTISNTSKSNYVMKMMPTYIALFRTNTFNQKVAEEMNKNLGTGYMAWDIKSGISLENIEDTTLLKVTVTTTDPEKSYQIAHQLETSIPKAMENTNNGLVGASVVDVALRPSAYQSLGYPKKCLIGFMAGAVLAAAVLILKDLLDVRIKSSDELTERYDIPVLGTIPDFELKPSTIQKSAAKEAK